MAGEATNGFEVIERVRSGGFDLLLLDLSMPGKSGIELIKQVKERARSCACWSSPCTRKSSTPCARSARAPRGYLTKESAAEPARVRDLGASRKGASTSARTSPSSWPSRCAPGRRGLHKHLSDREFEVFRLLVDGRSISDIAGRCTWSVKTVSTHKTRILEKMSATSVADLVRWPSPTGSCPTPPAPD